jgi:hypothetical protein
MEGFRERPEAPADVKAYWDERSTRMVVSFDWRDVWAQEHVQAFTVAKAMRLDVQVALREAVGKAINDGITFEQFSKELTPKLQSLGWWGKSEVTDPLTGELVDAQLGSPRRLRVIYQSNVRAARTAGFWQRAQRTKRALPYLVYELGPSEVHRKLHVEQQGKIYRVDDAYWNHWLGPNGWGCKCWARQISQAEADRLGGVSPETDLDFRQYTNKRTGEVTQVPHGIDPGWHTNPGISHTNFITAGRKLNESVASGAAVLGSQFNNREQIEKVASGLLSSPAIHNVFARAGTFDRNVAPNNDIATISAPLAILPDRIKKALDTTEAASLDVSVWTMEKQLRKHPDLDAEDYQALQALLFDGQLFADQDDKKIIVMGQHGNAYLHAVLQLNQARYKVNLLHLMRIDRRRFEARLRALEKIQSEEE